MEVIHSTRSCWNSPPSPISIQENGAVATDIVLDAFRQAILDDIQVDGIQDDQRIIIHAEFGGGVNPVAIPACLTQFREDFQGVVTALAGDEDVAFPEFIDTVSVFQYGFILRPYRCLSTRIGGGEEDWFKQVKVFFFLHTLHEHGTDHATPSNQSNQFHFNPLFNGLPVLPVYSAATTASPISLVPTRWQPGS